ncbi:hypothetical protein [Nocardia sp. Marseille-Q1738]
MSDNKNGPGGREPHRGTENYHQSVYRQQPSPCPDCCAGPDGGRHLTHASTCPVGVGADRAMQDDREWFEKHPLARLRHRPLTHAESVELAHALGVPVAAAVGEVTVTQVAPGLRVRMFNGSRLTRGRAK